MEGSGVEAAGIDAAGERKVQPEWGLKQPNRRSVRGAEAAELKFEGGV